MHNPTMHTRRASTQICRWCHRKAAKLHGRRLAIQVELMIFPIGMCSRVFVGVSVCVFVCICVVSVCTCKWKCRSAGVNRGFKNPGKAPLLTTRKIKRAHSRAHMQIAAPSRPPTLMTERRKEIKQSPLLCVDVNLGDGQVGEGEKRKSESLGL